MNLTSFGDWQRSNLDDFQGAEADCDAAIERNPFVVGAYQIRGLARIRQNKYAEAISDYKKALHYDPENVTPLAQPDAVSYSRKRL